MTAAPLHLIVAATLPGLLTALDTALQGRKGLTTLLDGGDIKQRLTDPARSLDVLILDASITPYPDEPVENTLWDLIWLASRRAPPTRTLLLVREDTFPPQIRDALADIAQQTGGGIYLLPHHVGPREQSDAITWITHQLDLNRTQRQAWLMPLSGSGGVGKSTQMANLALALGRRSYRVLMVDADFANGSLAGFFKVPPGEITPLMTLRDEFPKPVSSYPVEAVQRRIVSHPSGIDLLLSGRGVIEVQDMTAKAMQALLETIRQLPYDVVCLDAGPDIKARPYAIDVLRAGGTAIVMCPPGRKELRGAQNVLELMRHMAATGRNASMIEQAAILFIEQEHGSVANIQQVRRDMTRQYAAATDLGVMPRDARTISMVVERDYFCTVYDVAPKSPYCQALEATCDRLIAHLRLPSPQRAAASYARNGHHSARWSGLLRLLGIQRTSVANAGREEHAWN